jgi:hypothetical protein
MKSGWKTSEFWMMIFSIAAPVLGLPVEPVVAIGSGMYAAARTAYKVYSDKAQ